MSAATGHAAGYHRRRSRHFIAIRLNKDIDYAMARSLYSGMKSHAAITLFARAVRHRADDTPAPRAKRHECHAPATRSPASLKEASDAFGMTFRRRRRIAFSGIRLICQRSAVPIFIPAFYGILQAVSIDGVFLSHRQQRFRRRIRVTRWRHESEARRCTDAASCHRWRYARAAAPASATYFHAAMMHAIIFPDRFREP